MSSAFKKLFYTISLYSITSIQFIEIIIWWGIILN
jgi:hypothetical protein